MEKKITLVLDADHLCSSDSQNNHFIPARIYSFLKYIISEDDWRLTSRYPVFRFTVKNIEEIQTAFSSLQNKKIEALIINAYGHPFFMALSNKGDIQSELNIYNVDMFPNDIFQFFAMSS